MQVVQAYPTEVSISFAAVDDGSLVADVIGACFDGILLAHNRNPDEDAYKNWRSAAADLDPRIHVGDALALVTPDTAFPLFASDA